MSTFRSYFYNENIFIFVDIFVQSKHASSYMISAKHCTRVPCHISPLPCLSSALLVDRNGAVRLTSHCFFLFSIDRAICLHMLSRFVWASSQHTMWLNARFATGSHQALCICFPTLYQWTWLSSPNALTQLFWELYTSCGMA